MRLAQKSIRTRLADFSKQVRVGISSIKTFEPELVLPNSWYDSLMARKFVKHTGISKRRIAMVDEVDLAARALDDVFSSQTIQASDCAGLIFVCPSLIPQSVARKLLPQREAQQHQPTRRAFELANKTRINPKRILGINGFCSGYAKAMNLLQRKFLPSFKLESNQFIAIVTSSCISRITDFSCRQSGALFGDFASVTLVSRCDSAKYPVQFEIVDSNFEKVTTNRPLFDFSKRENVLMPTLDGGRKLAPSRIVFSIDGMGIADIAPRAMANAATKMIKKNDLQPEQIAGIVPHQAGAGIVRLTGMKLEQAGFEVAPINGLTSELGNVSSGSVPYALHQHWNDLEGNILCPVAAVGSPGKPEVSQGCVLLKAASKTRAVAG